MTSKLTKNGRKIARTRAKCSGNRSVITKLINEAEGLIQADEIDEQRLKIIADSLNKKLALVKSLDKEIIIESCNVEEIANEIPKLPKFKGDVMQWQGFWDSYNSSIHTNLQLTQIDKFNHLHSLLEGQAARSIEGSTRTEANYNSAIDLLHKRFGKPQNIISKHMDEMLKIPGCVNDNASQLRLVYDRISINIRGLESLGVSSSQYGSLLIPVLMSKLPSEIRIQVARNTACEVWEMSDLLEVIRQEVEACEISDGVKQT